MPQVSIIVLTYNPDNQKLKKTLRIAAAQKDVSFEIIISDDGSQRKDFSFLPEFMESLGVTAYTLLEHPVNKGTVQSCLQAVQTARGEYVFLTSPGDFLYDEYVLAAFYRFAQSHSANLCFGNAVYYAQDEQGARCTRQFGTPTDPLCYAPGTQRSQRLLHFFCGDWVIGASYFRSRELAVKTFRQIAEVSKYMEDTPSTAFALAQGEDLYYFDRNTVWYEDGTGVSTGASEKWKKLLWQDFSGSLTKLKSLFPTDPYVDIAYRNATGTNRFRRVLGKLLFHPVLTTQWIFKKKTPRAISCPQADLQRLNEWLQNP